MIGYEPARRLLVTRFPDVLCPSDTVPCRGRFDVSENAYFPRLFSPLRVGQRTLRNRIALPATTTNYGARNRVTDRWISFLAERAKGGAGMIITEIVAVDPAALCQASTVTGYESENEDGFKRAADAVEGEGACLVAQLWHPGRQQLWSPVASPKGISDQPDAYSWTVPHVMSTAELRQVVDEYVAVAARFRKCGFGGVELHGAHGYLITQILSPWSNRRTDDYGGSLENRIRFVREVADGIRASCGGDFVIGLKMPGDEGVAGGIDPRRSGADHGGARGIERARLFRLQPGQFHAQPGKPRAGHAFPARTLSRHSQEDAARERGPPGHGDRPDRNAR